MKINDREGHDDSFPPYQTVYSSDLKEYAAAQRIPQFGIQVYYAMSPEPVTKWYNSQNACLPTDYILTGIKHLPFFLLNTYASSKKDKIRLACYSYGF